MQQQHAPRLDREYAMCLAALGEPDIPPPSLAVGDIAGRRQRFDTRIQKALSTAPPTPNVAQHTHKICTTDGATITLVEFRPKNAPLLPAASSSPAIYHIHGGGMILGSVAAFTSSIAARAETHGLPVFSIEYRLAPEHPHPVPVNDCYAGLEWLHANAGELGIDRSRILVLGESAGGGLATGVALMARDRGLEPPIAFQMLIYPMLDDRNLRPRPSIERYTKWRGEDSKTAWSALLGESAGQDEAIVGHEYAAPARVRSVLGLPATYIDVGGLDYFAGEGVEYAARCLDAGVKVELHVYPGLPHDFEGMGAGARIVSGAVENRRRVVEEFKRGSS
jgi:acetyl esterase/lipase